VQCAETLRVHAYFDGELDATSAHELEQHLAHCVGCSDLLNDLKQVRGALRRDLKIERAPGDLRARVLASIDQQGTKAPVKSRVRPPWRRIPAFWVGACSGLTGAAVAAMVAWLLVLPTGPSALVGDLVNAHVHSLLPDHLIAVVSTDRHTVKPWFAGHADVSPTVADFEAQGYKLIGGRTDTLWGQRAAVVVYKRGPHTINVFSWASDRGALNQGVTRNGYHLDFWKVGNLQYCAVSDTGWDELQGLVVLLRELALREDRRD
jgi:mycothiol system anti-sigma-R factor